MFHHHSCVLSTGELQAALPEQLHKTTLVCPSTAPADLLHLPSPRQQYSRQLSESALFSCETWCLGQHLYECLLVQNSACSLENKQIAALLVRVRFGLTLQPSP